MYLSCLLINVASNPDRPRPGRLWLRNLYRVHQRLCMAFPTASRVAEDEDFLKPFKPEDFGSGQVHVARGQDTGFLFRIDPQPGSGRAAILVQSAVEPDWDYAFRNAGHLLAALPQVKSSQPSFTHGVRLGFRLVVNPTRKIDTKSGPDGRRRNGQRVPVPIDQLDEWLACRAGPAGFSIDKGCITVQSAYIYVNKAANGSGHRLLSVRYEGILKIIDPARFQETLVRGIGPAKAFGFGLLSVAPVRL